MDINEITKILPHRYPMLMVDCIVEMEPVLIVEAMAQVGGVLILSSIPNRDDKLVLFGSIEQAKFRRPVVPGDQLRIEMRILKQKASVAKMSGTATVNGAVVAEAILLCKLADKTEVATAPPKGCPPGPDEP